MKYILSVVFLICLTSLSYGQESLSLASKLKSLTKKGDYAILEVRLNNEDEFRTIEGGESSLARIAIFTGNNQGAEIVSKGFEGFNSIVSILNNLKENSWNLVQSYSINGESLIVTHYVLERKK